MSGDSGETRVSDPLRLKRKHLIYHGIEQNN